MYYKPFSIMDKVIEMDLDALVNESLQSEGIVGTIYYSDIKIESETSSDTNTSLSLQNDIEDRVIINDTDKDFQFQGHSTDANVNGINTMEGGKERLSESNNGIAVLSEEYQLPIIKFTTLLKLREKSRKEIIEFCIELGLIASKFNCPVCEKVMILGKKDIGDGYFWVCRNGVGEKSHKDKRVSKSIRSGSFISNTKLGLLNTLLIIHCWVYKLPREWISEELNINKATLVDWFDIYRDICVEICARDHSQIGGKGAIVEIEGGKYERRKNDENIKKNSFVFIGTENMYGDKTFLRIAEKCDKNSFLEVIKSYVLPGSTVISEFCSVFKCRRDWDFVDLAKSCKYKFKYPKCSSLSKRKSFWNVIRRKLPWHKKEYGFDHHIAEFLWRQRNYSAYDKMRRFLLHLKTIYPPPTIDG